MLDITLIPVLEDNYIFLLNEPQAKCTAVVDPAVDEPVLSYLHDHHLSLDYIFNTHHHWDHTGGNTALQKKTSCQIIGHSNDAERIPDINKGYADGDSFMFGAEKVHVIDVSGHTMGHIAYWFPASKALFCGDTLFSMGCGRLFEGTPEQMYHSLIKLTKLPEDTLIYCAHEYTKTNAEFALTLEPENSALHARYKEVCTLRQKGIPTIPTTLELELATNPFLRTQSPDIRETLNMPDATDIAVFTEIRKRKDTF